MQKFTSKFYDDRNSTNQMVFDEFLTRKIERVNDIHILFERPFRCEKRENFAKRAVENRFLKNDYEMIVIKSILLPQSCRRIALIYRIKYRHFFFKF